jgi:hypothetical protein
MLALVLISVIVVSVFAGRECDEFESDVVIIPRSEVQGRRCTDSSKPQILQVESDGSEGI